MKETIKLKNRINELETANKDLQKELEEWKQSRNELAYLVGIRREPF